MALIYHSALLKQCTDTHSYYYNNMMIQCEVLFVVGFFSPPILRDLKVHVYFSLRYHTWGAQRGTSMLWVYFDGLIPKLDYVFFYFWIVLKRSQI